MANDKTVCFLFINVINLLVDRSALKASFSEVNEVNVLFLMKS